jgi:hypothetical protein
VRLPLTCKCPFREASRHSKTARRSALNHVSGFGGLFCLRAQLTAAFEGLSGSVRQPAKFHRSIKLSWAAGVREFVESALTVAAYLAYIEYCAHKGRGRSCLFKGFSATKRSAGPLWKLFKDSMLAAGKNVAACAPLRELVEPPLYNVDRFVTEIAKEKHGKISGDEIDTFRPVQILANVLQHVFYGQQVRLVSASSEKEIRERLPGFVPPRNWKISFSDGVQV